MCGIGGFVMCRAISPREPAEARLWRMIATLRHRGPDDEGVWTDGRAGLAHARLSIIDLSPAAHQPMASADETVRITNNGEIYNFAAAGATPRSSSMAGTPGARRSSRVCAGCLRWRSGIGDHAA